MNRCTRYGVTGIACLNVSKNEDGWCRNDDCPGFTRPNISDAPTLKDVKFYGSPEEIAATAMNPATLECGAHEIAISSAAVRQFKFHHGGTPDEAEVQMRWMLADFLKRSGRVVSETNYLVLSRDGYRLHIAPNRERITGYTTVHRERTWEQFKREIPSRIGRIDAQPMPILNLRKLAEPAPVASKRPKPLRHDVTIPGLKSQAAPSPRISNRPVSPASMPAVRVTPGSGPADSTTPHAPLPPSAPPTAPKRVSANSSNTSNRPPDHTAGSDRAPSQLPALAKPIAPLGNSDSTGPSTFKTATVSVLSTLVVIRAARWLGRSAKR
jgi:hypothetical protein